MNALCTTKRAVNVDELISLRDAARLAGLHERTITWYAATGTIPSLKVGFARVFVLADVEAWIAARDQRKAQRQARKLSPRSNTEGNGDASVNL